MDGRSAYATPINLGILAVAVILLSGCTESRLRLNPDFGAAVRQDLAAQVADPDAHYAGVPEPGSDGARVGLAQKRYEKGEVIQPSTVGASDIGVSSAGGAPSAAPASPNN